MNHIFNVSVSVKQLVKLCLLFGILWFCKLWVDNRIIHYIAAYDNFIQEQKDDVAVPKGEGEPGHFDHSNDKHTT